MIDPMEVISRNWNRVPVPIERIVEECGLSLAFRPLPDPISGWIERVRDGKYAIVVNSNHAKVRRRFTAAHELGHYIYHRDLLGDGVGDNRAYRADGTNRPNPNIRPQHERQANSFAANILMPRHLVSYQMDRATPELAALFEVSEEAMRIRLGRGAQDQGLRASA